jgi:hypothetical protein
MAYKIHVLSQYYYGFDCRSGLPYFQLWSETGNAKVRFVKDEVDPPDLTFSNDLTEARIYLRQSDFPHIVDLLRNERPVKLTINNQPPGFVFLHTGEWEPTGEEESSLQ